MNVYFFIYLTNRGVNLWQRKLLLFVLFFFFLYFNVHSEEEKVIFLLSLGVHRKGIVWNLASSVSFFSFLLLWLDGKLEKLVEGEELSGSLKYLWRFLLSFYIVMLIYFLLCTLLCQFTLLCLICRELFDLFYCLNELLIHSPQPKKEGHSPPMGTLQL